VNEIKTCETCESEYRPIHDEPCDECMIIFRGTGERPEWKPKLTQVIKVKLMNTTDQQFLPTRKHQSDAGADLRARMDQNFSLVPGQMKKIPTGIAVEIPNGHVGLVIARSGATTDGKVTLIGAVDSGYRGEIGMNVINLSRSCTTIKMAERLAQLIIVPCLVADFLLSDELSEGERGDKGFGSTGRD